MILGCVIENAFDIHKSRSECWAQVSCSRLSVLFAVFSFSGNKMSILKVERFSERSQLVSVQ